MAQHDFKPCYLIVFYPFPCKDFMERIDDMGTQKNKSDIIPIRNLVQSNVKKSCICRSAYRNMKRAVHIPFSDVF